MNVQTISGKITGLGKLFESNLADQFEYIEVQQADGGFKKVYSVNVATECRRAIAVGNVVTLAYYQADGFKSKAFPHNDGMATVYAVASLKDGRVFDDVNRLSADVSKLRSLASRMQMLVWGFVAFMVGTWAMGKSPFLLSLFGMFLPLGLHFFSAAPIKKLSLAAGTKEEFEPHMARLSASGLADLRKAFPAAQDSQ